MAAPKRTVLVEGYQPNKTSGASGRYRGVSSHSMSGGLTTVSKTPKKLPKTSSAVKPKKSK